MIIVVIIIILIVVIPRHGQHFLGHDSHGHYKPLGSDLEIIKCGLVIIVVVMNNLTLGAWHNNRSKQLIK